MTEIGAVVLMVRQFKEVIVREKVLRDLWEKRHAVVRLETLTDQGL